MVNDTFVQKEEPASIVRKKSRVGILLATISVLVVAGGALGLAKWRASRSVVFASSAEVVADSNTVLTTVDGSVQELLVKPGQLVKQGEVLAIIANTSLVQKYTAAEKAATEAKKADLTTQAAIVPPTIQGNFLPSAPSFNLKNLHPLPDVGSIPSTRPTIEMPASVAPTDKKVLIAKSDLATSEKSLDKSTAQVASAQADLDAAQSELTSQTSPLDALKSTLDLAKGKRDKFQGLYNDGIISRSEFQAKETDYETAQNNVDDATKSVQTAQEAVKAKQAALTAANKDLEGAKADVAKSQALVTKAESDSQKIASKPVQTPVVQPPSTRVAKKREKLFVPHFNLAPPAIAPLKLVFSPDKHMQAQTQVEDASRRLKRIGDLLQACRILAPFDGTVTGIRVKQGVKVVAKTSVLTLVKPASQRIVATFEHDQALRIHYGQKCEVMFDAIPKHVFLGTVSRFLDGGGPMRSSKVQISLPNQAGVLATLPAGSVSHVKVLLG